MTIKELSRDELVELKQSYYSQKNKNMNCNEIVNVDELVSDSEIFNAYQNTEFVEEDFFCNLDKENEDKIEKDNVMEEEEYL